jgi:hypothetical protein
MFSLGRVGRVGGGVRGVESPHRCVGIVIDSFNQPTTTRSIQMGDPCDSDE